MPIPVVGAAYLGAQLARQIPATAGGLGVIEAGLILVTGFLGPNGAGKTTTTIA